MKLNYKRTLLAGFAFLGISAFWQLYDSIITLILKFDFGISDQVAGWIMSLDNVLALFLLPLFGMLSDKTSTRIGKRMPYILGGTLVGAAAFLLIPLTAQAKDLLTFFIVLMVALLSMSTYRSPAVSLMPDITPKPLRSKANALINLMGTIGGLAVLLCVSFMMKADYYALCAAGHKTSIASTAIRQYTCDGCGASHTLEEVEVGLQHNSFLPLFAVTAGIMLLCLGVLLLFIRENRFVKEREQTEVAFGIAEENEEEGGAKMPREVKRSLVFLLLSVAFWYMAYNAVTTAFSKYVLWYWNLPDGGFANCMMIAMAAAAVSFVPIGILSSKIGRKKMILFGCALLTAMFVSAIFFRQYHSSINILFALVGIAWASINVNSYPMVVEMSRGSNIGRYTGLYYAFSMAAQIVTPILSGYLLNISYATLFPYAAIFAGLSFVTMLFVRHGDSLAPKKSLLEHMDVEA